MSVLGRPWGVHGAQHLLLFKLHVEQEGIHFGKALGVHEVSFGIFVTVH